MARQDRVTIKKHLSFSSFDDFIIQHTFDPDAPPSLTTTSTEHVPNTTASSSSSSSSTTETEAQRLDRLRQTRCRSAEPPPTTSEFSEFRSSKSNGKRKVSIRTTHMPTIFHSMEHAAAHLLAIHNEKMLAEKSELKELNGRLGRLIADVKNKKRLNDELQAEIRAFKNKVISTYDPGETGEEAASRAKLRDELASEKRRLNEISETRNFLNIKLFRSGVDSTFKRTVQEEESRHKKEDEAKVRALELTYRDGLNEILLLNDRFEYERAAVEKQADTVNSLRCQIDSLNDSLDCEVERRVRLEHQCELLNEAKRFEIEVYERLRAEFIGMLDSSLHSDAGGSAIEFVECELSAMKERIRLDFETYAECLHENMRDEYNEMLCEVVEEERCRAETCEAETREYEWWREEAAKNECVMRDLDIQWQMLSSRHASLAARLGEQRRQTECMCAGMDGERDELAANTAHLKCELSKMLSTSRSLDSEVSLYARLLGNRQHQVKQEVVTTTTTTKSVGGNHNGSSSSNRVVFNTG
jgi:23S rRNA pseudoU1915 N3-methylase RlmH